MKILFKRIEIENFLSIGSASIDLDNQGFVQISGVNNCVRDNSISNGSGKSSIFESLVWCLTGDTIRGSARDISNLHTDDGACVTVLCTIDGVEYNIKRSKNHSECGTNLKIIRDGKDVSGKGIRDSEKILSELLPELTSSLIGSVIVLGQGLPQRFTNNTPSGRKDVLEKLSKSDFMIEDLKARISSRQEELEKKYNKINEEIIVQNATRSNLVANINSDEEVLSSVGDEDELNESIISLQNSIDSAQLSIDAMEETRSSTLAQLQECQAKVAEIADINTEKSNQITSKYFDDISAHNVRYAELSACVKSYEDKIAEYKNIKDICPTCGQKIAGVVKPDLEPLYKEAHKYNILRMACFDETEELKRNEAKERSDLKHYYEESKRAVSVKIQELQSALNTLNAQLLNQSTVVSRLAQEVSQKQSEKENRAATIKMFSERIQDNQAKLSQLDEKILYNTNERDLCRNHINVVSKFKTLITRDFRGYLLSNVINYINIKSKEYSNLIFNTDKTSFELNGNNIDISYDGKMYENLSGGEKQKIDLIVQLSLRDMLCEYLNFSSNILVVDEIFDNLDAHGCDKVVNMITSKLSDIDSVFIITHHMSLNIPYDKEVIVIKDEQGVSSVT